MYEVSLCIQEICFFEAQLFSLSGDPFVSQQALQGSSKVTCQRLKIYRTGYEGLRKRKGRKEEQMPTF